jgi:hypothetical protein
MGFFLGCGQMAHTNNFRNYCILGVHEITIVVWHEYQLNGIMADPGLVFIAFWHGMKSQFLYAMNINPMS